MRKLANHKLLITLFTIIIVSIISVTTLSFSETQFNVTTMCFRNCWTIGVAGKQYRLLDLHCQTDRPEIAAYWTTKGYLPPGADKWCVYSGHPWINVGTRRSYNGEVRYFWKRTHLLFADEVAIWIAWSDEHPRESEQLWRLVIRHLNEGTVDGFAEAEVLVKEARERFLIGDGRNRPPL